LEAAAAARGLENVQFIETIPKVMVQSMLEEFDVCYIGWLKSPLYEYGISANKLFDYLYSGRPIVHAYSGAYDPVEVYGAGVTVPAEDPASLAAAILQLRNLPEEQRRRMGENGQRAAIQHHEYGTLALQLEAVLLGDDAGEGRTSLPPLSAEIPGYKRPGET
jgi:glycosyltransferase involved in cell wall biosynthesis